MKLKLITFRNNICTMGKLYHDKELICNTFELPWRKNSVNVSCVPAGEYVIKMTNSNKFGPCYKLQDVIGRTDILIHKGNTVDDTLGCIMPCSSFGLLPVRTENKATDVVTNEMNLSGLSSKLAYDKLMNVLAGDNHTLTIERY